MPVHPYLGVSLMSVNAYNARKNGLSVDSGAYVAEVNAEGPAYEAGIEKGDIVVAVNGGPISSADGLIIALREHEVGDKVTLTVVRGNVDLLLEGELSGEQRACAADVAEGARQMGTYVSALIDASLGVGASFAPKEARLRPLLERCLLYTSSARHRHRRLQRRERYVRPSGRRRAAVERGAVA